MPVEGGVEAERPWAELLPVRGWLLWTAPLAPAGANDFAAKPAEAANFAASLRDR